MPCHRQPFAVAAALSGGWLKLAKQLHDNTGRCIRCHITASPLAWLQPCQEVSWSRATSCVTTWATASDALTLPATWRVCSLARKLARAGQTAA